MRRSSYQTFILTMLIPMISVSLSGHLCAQDIKGKDLEWPQTQMSWSKDIKPALERAIIIREVNTDGDSSFFLTIHNCQDPFDVDSRILKARSIFIKKRSLIFSLYDTHQIFNKESSDWGNPSITSLEELEKYQWDISVFQRQTREAILTNPTILSIIIPPIRDYLVKHNVRCLDMPAYSPLLNKSISIAEIQSYVASYAFCFHLFPVTKDEIGLSDITRGDFLPKDPSSHLQRVAFFVLWSSKPIREQVKYILRSIERSPAYKAIPVSGKYDYEVRELYEKVRSDTKLRKLVNQFAIDGLLLLNTTCSDCEPV